MTTEAASGFVLVVDACADTERLLGDPAMRAADLAVERVTGAGGAIERIEHGERVEVVLLAPRLPDPVRIAQRVHSLDRQGAVVILAPPDHEADVRHALDVAPFLEGDVTLVATTEAPALARELADAAGRTRARRAAEEERRRRRETPPPLSARYLGTLLDSAPIGIVTLDADRAVIGWNRRAGEMLEAPEVEALGTAFEELFPAADRDRLRALVDGLTSAGISAEPQVFDRDGRTFEISGAHFAIRSGETGTLLILQDVTARVAAERELRIQTVLLEAQAESAIAGIAVVNIDGRLERVNSRFSEIWGLSDADIRADRQAALDHMLGQLEEPELFMAGVDALAMNPGADFGDELRLRDGRTLERYGTHMRTDDGELIGRIWFYTDITARTRDEEALRFLADATNLLSSSLDYEITLQRVAELAVPRIADWCEVEVGDSPAHQAVAVAQVDAAKGKTARELRDRSPTDPSVMIVPIKVRERVFGAISFVSADPARRYEEEDFKLAEELARRAAIAIDNSRVHAELRQTARALQESLLPPHLPEIENVEVAARFRAASAGMQVGGDFYDIFETGDGRWGVAIGDVCGKGAEAAALTALTRYTVRAAAMYEDTAGGVLEVLNRALLRQRGDFRFTTVSFSVLDLGGDSCTLRTSCGGHPQPLLLRPDGTTEAVGACGPLLGVMPEARFAEDEVSLEAGDVLLLYTDGVTDAHAPERIIDEALLLQTLAGCAGMTAEEVARRIEDVAIGNSDEPPRDDIAIVVVKLGT